MNVCPSYFVFVFASKSDWMLLWLNINLIIFLVLNLFFAFIEEVFLCMERIKDDEENFDWKYVSNINIINGYIYLFHGVSL